MPSVFGNQHEGDQRLSRQAALDQPLGRRRLNHRLLARPASVFRTVRHDHPELGRNDIEPLRYFLADHMHGRAATGAFGVVGRNCYVDMRQMGGKRAAIVTPLVAAHSRARRVLPVVGRLIAGNGLFDILKLPAAAVLDRASPNVGRSAHAAIGVADDAAGHSATAPGRGRQRLRRVPRALPRPAPAALRCRWEVDLRPRSRLPLNPIREPLWTSGNSLIHHVAGLTMSPLAAQCRGHADATNPSRRREASARRQPHQHADGGHRNAPSSRRFHNSTNPDPSQTRIFSRSARFERKMKIVPQNGS